MMTVEDINKSVQEIANSTGDPEMAHSMEDGLFVEVLTAIAEGKHPLNASRIAEAALKSKEIEFPRWCA